MNLLPNTERESLKKGLKLRFATMTLFIISASLLIGFVSLLPAYFLTANHLSNGYSSGVKDDGSTKEMLNLPGEINLKLGFLQSSVNGIAVTDFFSKIINYLPNEITLNSITFAKKQSYKEKNGTIISISGIAANRDSLVSFSALLKESGSFSSVEVPVSNLTKNKDLPFSMSIFIED